MRRQGAGWFGGYLFRSTSHPGSAAPGWACCCPDGERMHPASGTSFCLTLSRCSFFDTTKTGEITSRLSADTTTVSDQICLNLNVMLRSATQVGYGWGRQTWPIGARPGFARRAGDHALPAQLLRVYYSSTYFYFWLAESKPLLLHSPQAAMVLVFMFSASWRLTVVTFGAHTAVGFLDFTVRSR